MCASDPVASSNLFAAEFTSNFSMGGGRRLEGLKKAVTRGNSFFVSCRIELNWLFWTQFHCIAD